MSVRHDDHPSPHRTSIAAAGRLVMAVLVAAARIG